MLLKAGDRCVTVNRCKNAVLLKHTCNCMQPKVSERSSPVLQAATSVVVHAVMNQAGCARCVPTHTITACLAYQQVMQHKEHHNISLLALEPCKPTSNHVSAGLSSFQAECAAGA